MSRVFAVSLRSKRADRSLFVQPPSTIRLIGQRPYGRDEDLGAWGKPYEFQPRVARTIVTLCVNSTRYKRNRSPLYR